MQEGSVRLDDAIVFGNQAGATGYDLGGAFAESEASFRINDSLVGTILPGTLATLNNTLLGFDPFLGPLQDNGGPTPTHALLPGSPAIDAGDPSALAGVDGVPEFDQRGPGFTRVAGAAIDIGAFEVQTQPPGMSAVVDDMDGDGDYDIADLLAAQRGVVPAAQALSVDFDLPVDGPERAERDALFATAPLGPVRPQPALFDTPVVSVAAVADGLVELLAQVDDEREPEDEEARELDEVFAEWV
ncbi:MAG: choice-of-anchor Q domain-containing protein [Planctomycetota bacterium]